MFTWSVQEGLGKRSNHRLYRLLLSTNLLEHVFEGLGCVNECYRSLFTTITKTKTSKQTNYICHVGERLDSKVCFLVPKTHFWNRFLYQCENIQQFIIARFVLYLYRVSWWYSLFFYIFSNKMYYIYFLNFILSTISINIILCNIQWISKLLMAWKNMIHLYVISIYLFIVSKLSQVDIDMKT